MSARSVSVTIVGWVLIVVGALSLLSVGLTAAVPSLSPGAPNSMAVIAGNLCASLIELLCGVYILKGADWSRWLYVVLSLASTAYLLLIATIPTGILAGWGVFVILTLAGLFTPAASRYFAGTTASEAEPV